MVEARCMIQWRDFSAALLTLALGIAFLVWAQAYPPKAAAVPTLVAWLTIVLSLVDLVSHTATAAGRLLGRLAGSENAVEWKVEGDQQAPAWRIASSVGWLLAYLVAMMLAGILLATPAYIFLYMTLHGRRSALASALVAIGTTAGVWLIFVLAFRYPLYPGLLFGGY
jgi:hypothetical protein